MSGSMGRKKVSKVDADTSRLQKILSNPLYDAGLLAVILLNCVAMCMVDPTVDDDQQEPWIVNINWFFNIVYVIDVALMLLAFGPNHYFMDRWHYLDAVVSTVSLIELMVPAVDAISLSLGFGTLPMNNNFSTFLSTLQIVRVLRPLKAITFLPSLLEFLEACTRSFGGVSLNFSFLLFSLSSISVITNYLVANSLKNRCIPEDFTTLT